MLTDEVAKDECQPEAWRVEAIDYECDGQIYLAVFSGPDSQQRAREYAAFKDGGKALLTAASRVKYLKDNYPRIAADLEQIASEDWR